MAAAAASCALGALGARPAAAFPALAAPSRTPTAYVQRIKQTLKPARQPRTRLMELSAASQAEAPATAVDFEGLKGFEDRQARAPRFLHPPPASPPQPPPPPPPPPPRCCLHPHPALAVALPCSSADTFAVAIMGDLHLEPAQMHLFEEARAQLAAAVTAGGTAAPRVVQLGALMGGRARGRPAPCQAAAPAAAAAAWPATCCARSSSANCTPRPRPPTRRPSPHPAPTPACQATWAATSSGPARAPASSRGAPSCLVSACPPPWSPATTSELCLRSASWCSDARGGLGWSPATPSELRSCSAATPPPTGPCAADSVEGRDAYGELELRASF